MNGRLLSIDDLRFFATLSVCQSLAAAARELGVTPPAVTQRLRLLEAKLGLRLVDRSTRRLRLTDEGLLLAEGGQRIVEDISQLADRLAVGKRDVAGHLRIVASFGFGRRYVAPVVAAFRIENPNVSVTLTLSESPVRLSADLLGLAGPRRRTERLVADCPSIGYQRQADLRGTELSCGARASEASLRLKGTSVRRLAGKRRGRHPLANRRPRRQGAIGPNYSASRQQ